MDYTRNTVRAAVKAMQAVVAPAVNTAGQGQAMEQVRLVTDFLQFVEQRIHLIGDRENSQLRACIELAHILDPEIEGFPSCDSLRAARSYAEEVASNPFSDSVTRRRATAKLESAVRLVVIESAESTGEQRRSIETAVLAAASRQIEADRAWLLPLQFDAEPESVVPVATALGMSSG